MKVFYELVACNHYTDMLVVQKRRSDELWRVWQVIHWPRKMCVKDPLKICDCCGRYSYLTVQEAINQVWLAIPYANERIAALEFFLERNNYIEVDYISL